MHIGVQNYNPMTTFHTVSPRCWLNKGKKRRSRRIRSTIREALALAIAIVVDVVELEVFRAGSSWLRSGA